MPSYPLEPPWLSGPVSPRYRTFGVLAKVLPAAGALPGTRPGVAAGAVPPLDSLNMWPLLSAATATGPRTGGTIPLSQFAIIVGDHKYINGSVHDHESWNGAVCGPDYTNKDCEMGQWTGPDWPTANCGGGGPQSVCPHVCNAATNCTRNTPCSTHGCVFDIARDPLEKTDLSLQQPALLAELQAAMRQAVAARFQTTDSGMVYSGCAESWAANVAAHGGQ